MVLIKNGGSYATDTHLYFLIVDGVAATAYPL
jgi:hypothetical protein